MLQKFGHSRINTFYYLQTFQNFRYLKFSKFHNFQEFNEKFSEFFKISKFKKILNFRIPKFLISRISKMFSF
jgi:hypothetical protein